MFGVTRPPGDAGVIRATPAFPVALSQRRKRLTLAATILGSSMAFIDGSVVNVALPAIQQALHADAASTQWIVNGYLLLLGALVLVGGAAADLYGRRRIFLTGIAVFTAASVACGLSPTVEALILSRAMQGLGAALLDACKSCDAGCDIRPARAQPRHRHLGRRRRADGGGGSGARRLAGRSRVVARDLPAQRAAGASPRPVLAIFFACESRDPAAEAPRLERRRAAVALGLGRWSPGCSAPVPLRGWSCPDRAGRAGAGSRRCWPRSWPSKRRVR